VRVAAIWPRVTAVFANAIAKSFGAQNNIYIDNEQIKSDKAACLPRGVGFASAAF